MKTFIGRGLVLVGFSIITGLSPKQIQAQQIISVQVFYDELSPYGQWVNYSNYGYVWIPTVGIDFFPYSSHGYWCYTRYGWTWVSYYTWGWAPFHYGRWDYDPFYGWFWVPDYKWGPAWVMWRSSPGYYGWTYLRPGHNHKKLLDNSYYGPRKDWTFIEEKRMGRNDVEKYYAPRTNNESLINNSTIVGHTYEDKDRNVTYITGPHKEELEKSTGIPVKIFAIEENSNPGQVSIDNNKLKIYRPTVVEALANEAKPAPAKPVDLKEIKPVSERKMNEQPGDSKPSSAPAKNNVDPAEQPSKIEIEKSKPEQIEKPKAKPKPADPILIPRKQENIQQPKKINPPTQQPTAKPNTPPKTNPPAQQAPTRPNKAPRVDEPKKIIPPERTKPQNAAPNKPN